MLGDFFMKKILIIFAILTIIYLSYNKEEYYIIPKDAIRFRVIANSNSTYDQYVKYMVNNNLQKEFKNTLSMSLKRNEMENALKNNVINYSKIIENTLKEENYNYEFNINYGINYFPEKIYKGIKYEAGNYDSLVVTLGSGNGDNFWCLLFPPVCMMSVEDKKTEKIEYKIFIKDLMEKYFKN